jgi:cytochrome P450
VLSFWSIKTYSDNMLKACPGWKFAMMEMKVFVATLVSQFEFFPAKEIRRNYM